MKRYRVIANKYTIESVMIDGEFNTAAANDKLVVAGTKDDLITMLSALAIDVSELDKYE